MHVLDDAATKTVLGKHTLYHLDEEGVVAGLDVLVEGLLHHDLGGRYTLSAGIAGVVVVNAVCPLVAGELNLVGVDDDDVVTTFHVG